MKKFVLFLLISSVKLSFAQTTGVDCNSAISLSQVNKYCSDDGQYTNLNANKVSWFKFTATAYDVDINVSGNGTGNNTLLSPVIRLFTNCNGGELLGTSNSANNITSFYKGGLAVGTVYYIEVYGQNNATGSFKLCVNNSDPALKDDQDCFSASFLCSTDIITQNNVSGAGLFTSESKGTCLDGGGPGPIETNSVWYKWLAANNGTLVFTITPSNVNDDIDWVLYDLGTTGDCSNVNAANAIRCASGSGVNNNTQCPQEPVYYKTGLDFNEIDLTESPGCGKGQNGKVKFITMVPGHIYGLLINNFSSKNNGFTLSFTDQAGVAGSARFAEVQPAIAYTGPEDCTLTPQYTFNCKSATFQSYKWTFGEGANILTASTSGPHTVTYSTSGDKTITLETQGKGGCIYVVTQHINVLIKPPLPPITTDKDKFCMNDIVHLSTPEEMNTTYQWTGPNNFTSNLSHIIIPVTGDEIAGTYNLIATRGQCSSDVASFIVPKPLKIPIAAFHTTPLVPEAIAGPFNVKFTNESLNADSYFWDFGDGTTSTEKNPAHVFYHDGQFSIKLTAINSNVCSISIIKTALVIIKEYNNFIFIPNAFTPNDDGINDDFKVTITNLSSYHIKIFNRLGQLLFESADINDSWKGNYKGNLLPSGTYYYVIKGVGLKNNIISQAGYVAIVR